MKYLHERNGNTVEVELIHGRTYALYVNDNYLGTYNKTIINIKLRGWGFPEI